MIKKQTLLKGVCVKKKLKLIEKNQKTQNNQSFTEQNYQRCPQYTKEKMFGNHRARICREIKC